MKPRFKHLGTATVFALGASSLALLGLAVGQIQPAEASAKLFNSAGQQVGTATFRETGNGTQVSLEVAGLPPGMHGMHVHARGECGSGPDEATGEIVPFGNAGPHLDPATTRNHASPDTPATQGHAGDMPMLEVGQDGRGVASFSTAKLGVRPGLYSVLDRSLVVHADADDYESDPAGNSGARLVCGVILPAGTKIRARVPLPGSDVFPEGVAYDPATKLVYTGSSSDGTIYKIDSSTGKAEKLTLGGSPGRNVALGMKLDKAGNLWVAAGATGKVAVVRTRDGATLKIIDSPRSLANGQPSPEPYINDLIPAPDGSVYVTDSFRPVLFRVRPGSKQMEAWLELSRTPIRYAPGINLNGIVITPDGRYLIAVQSNTGQLWRIDTRSKAVREVQLDQKLQNGDGLVLSGRDLWVVRNAQGEVVKVAMSTDFASGRVVSRLQDPAFRFPTTAALAGSQLWVVNAQLDKQRDPPPVQPFTVVSVPVR